MAIIKIPTSLYSNDIDGPIKSAYADTNTGKYYWDSAGNSPMVLTVNTGESLEQQWVGTDPKTHYILSDPISVKMLQSGYQPTDMGNVYFNPTTQKYAISRNQEGIDKIWGGFYQSYDPQTGAVIIGDASRGWDIVQHAIDYRNSIYTGGDRLSNILGTYAVPAMMSAFGGAAMGGMLPYEGAELAGLQASTTGLGTTAADAAAAQTALQGATLPSSLRTAISAGGQAITGAKPGDIAKSIGSQQAASALSNYAWGDTSGSTLSGLGKDITQYGLTYGLSNLLNKGKVQPTYELGGRTGQTQGAQTPSLQAPSPSSSALAQILKTDMGAPVFGSAKDKDEKPQKWGEGDLTGSSALREMGSGIV